MIPFKVVATFCGEFAHYRSKFVGSESDQRLLRLVRFSKGSELSLEISNRKEHTCTICRGCTVVGSCLGNCLLSRRFFSRRSFKKSVRKADVMISFAVALSKDFLREMKVDSEVPYKPLAIIDDSLLSNRSTLLLYLL